MSIKLIKDILIKNRELVSLSSNDYVRDAARLMKHRHVGSVLIIDENNLQGIFTERDVVYRIIAEGLDPDLTELKKVMTAKPITIDLNDTTLHALEIMQKGNFRHLPVTREDTLYGIVSRRDFVQ
ncbi:CBS domain-containing protein [Alphaproteobacteria bacterium]|nr:CBS domain-containing protein [Alphaproteobacteria bacterium]